MVGEGALTFIASKGVLPPSGCVGQLQRRLLISGAAGKSCQLDPIPTPIVLKLLDVLLPVITKLINLLTQVDLLRPGKRRLCYHLSRSLVWTLRSKISVQSVTSLIFLNCRRGLGLSNLWSIWLPTIYILCFNRRINSNTARRRPYLKLKMIFWCLWMSNMSPCLYY